MGEKVKDPRLGCKAQDSVSGLEGTVTAVCEYAHGETTICIESQAKDGKIPSTWLSESRVTMLETKQA